MQTYTPLCSSPIMLTECSTPSHPAQQLLSSTPSHPPHTMSTCTYSTAVPDTCHPITHMHAQSNYWDEPDTPSLCQNWTSPEEIYAYLDARCDEINSSKMSEATWLLRPVQWDEESSTASSSESQSSPCFFEPSQRNDNDQMPLDSLVVALHNNGILIP